MPPAPDRIRDRLSSHESLHGVHHGTLADRASPAPATIGVTDHRLLCLAADGTFVTVGHDDVTAVRSRPRTDLAFRGVDHRVLVTVGVVTALLGLVATALLASGPFVALVVFLAAAAFAVAGGLSVRPPDAPPVVPPDLVARLDRAFDGDDVRAFAERTVPDAWDADTFLFCGAVLFGVVCVALAAAVASLAIVVAPAFLSLGFGLVAYGYRRPEWLVDAAFVRRRTREIRVRTAEGRPVVVRSDPATTLDSELGRVALVGRTESAARVVAEP